MADLSLGIFSLVLLFLSLALFVFLAFIVRPRPVKFSIKNRHVFITGGSSGIGLALAQQAASQGAKVSILAPNTSRLEDAKETIRLSTGRDVAIFSADVRDYQAVKKAIEEAGPIDVLVCNQGVFVPQELETQDIEEIKSMINVNLTGTFHLIKAVLPRMKNRVGRGPGSIAIMSSQAGQQSQKQGRHKLGIRAESHQILHCKIPGQASELLINDLASRELPHDGPGSLTLEKDKYGTKGAPSQIVVWVGEGMLTTRVVKCGTRVKGDVVSGLAHNRVCVTRD